MATRLSEEAIQAQLAELPDWLLDNGMIVRTFRLRDFASALLFVGAVGYLAEAANHHPDILINYNRVRLALVTHDAGGLTEQDFTLAKQIDALPGAE